MTMYPQITPIETVKQWRMLLAEDNDSHAKLVKRVAQNSNQHLKIEHVMDGQSVLETLRGNLTEARPLPHLLLLDLHLPKLNGMEVLRSIKTDLSLRKLPVVIFSSSDNHEEIEEAYKLGANSYLIKPIDYEKLKQIIQELSTYWFDYNRVP